MSTTIEAEVVPPEAETRTMAVARVQSGAVGPALSVEQIHERLEFVRKVMREEMKEGVDYGKIPGTGDKPSLLQPGAQKLLMTFNLRAVVRKEVKTDIPMSIFGHREYEFTIRVFPNGCDPEREGTDGVGTCSTLESKYRYRKATRVCPNCGKEAIIIENPEFVRGREPGFVCWKKKDGCGQVFRKDHPDIVSQSLDDVENEDPADQWNTVRKMGFKRGLVAAVINFTNTSELWTQDVEDMQENKGKQRAKDYQNAPGRSGGVSQSTSSPKASPTPTAATPPQQKTAPSPKTITPQQAIFADPDTRNRMIAMFSQSLDLLHEFFVKAGCILETEKLEDLPLRFVPVTRRQAKALETALAGFGNGEEAGLPYPPNPEAEAPKPKSPVQESQPPKAKDDPNRPKTPSVEAAKAKDPEWFWDVIISVPRKGMKKAEYDKKPDTIGSLYNAMKEGDKEAQSRLWGLVHHWDCQPREFKGKTYPPSDADKACRDALDAFAEYEQKYHADSPTQSELAVGEAIEAEDDVPF